MGGASDGCGATNTFRVRQVTVSHDSKGNKKEDEDVLLENRLVTRDAAQWLIRFGGAST